jgi:gas vesicle protein
MDTKDIIKKYRNKNIPDVINRESLVSLVDTLVKANIEQKSQEISDNLDKVVKGITEDVKKLTEDIKKKGEGEITKYLDTFGNRKIELRGNNGRDGINGQNGSNGIDGKNGKNGKNGETPVVYYDKIIMEVVGQIGDLKEKGNEIISKINGSSDKILISSVKNLQEELDKLKNEIRVTARSGKTSSGGGMGMPVHESKSLTSSTTSVQTNQKVSAKGYAIWIYYQGQMVARGVGYTMSNDNRTINLSFTPTDGTFLDIIYIRTS